MKTNGLILVVLSVIFTNFSCTKDENVEIEKFNLTPCPANARCQYRFSEDADLNPNSNRINIGAYRLFWSDVEDDYSSTKLYIMAPMEGKQFFLDKFAILAERVKIMKSCTLCFSVPMKPVDGYVKGINITPNKRADQTIWLLKIKLFLESGGVPLIRDTLEIDQYFHPNFVYN